MTPGDLRSYEPIIGREEVESILSLAERIRGAKITHVNATAYGGGVAEILRSQIPLARSVGINAEWLVLNGNQEFFCVTKSIHNALQGNASIKLGGEMWEIYLKTNQENARTLDLEQPEGDHVVVIHDPQPLPLIEYKKNGGWVWRCHIDTSQPNRQIWNFLKPFVQKYDALVFTHEAYVPRDINNRVYVRHPCIDPLSEKNMPLSETKILKVLERFDLDPERPIVGQVARFDPWKNPLGVIEAYRIVKRRVPDVQLVMIGSFAHDDPECGEWCEKTIREAGTARDVHVLTNLSDVEVNALQRSFTLAFQLSIREGFGLAVTEALWKGVPVVGTRVGGIPLQVIDGVTGFLVDSVHEAAEKAYLLLTRRRLAKRLGRNGTEHVRKNFLLTKDLKDHLILHLELVGG